MIIKLLNFPVSGKLQSIDFFSKEKSDQKIIYL